MVEPASMVGAMRRSEPDELEAGLNALIERRAANAEHADDPQAREEGWKASERAYQAERREANRHAWRSYYQRLARNLRTSADHFENKAESLAADGCIGHTQTGRST